MACWVLPLPKRGNPCPGKQTTAPKFICCMVLKQDHDTVPLAVQSPGKRLHPLRDASAQFIAPLDLAIKDLLHLC